MTIKWVNHASYILEHEGVRLLHDPWLRGRVFNESWAHISESALTPEDFKDITHIWFSHEHPDHFFPPNITAIPAEYRSKITVLFQKTIDGKVKAFCAKQGFKDIIELEQLSPFNISTNLAVQIGKVKNDTDSWMYLSTPELTLLNVNDCILEPNDIAQIKSITKRPLDLLLTQFSYANWSGNSPQEREQSAKSKLASACSYIKEFNPAFTIPFASFVWFCHEDNFHMNDKASGIRETTGYFQAQTPTHVVVMYPGQQWNVGDKTFNNLTAIEAYEKDTAAIMAAPKLTPRKVVTQEALFASAQKFTDNSLRLNDRKKLLSYRPFTAYIKDWNKAFRFSYQKMELIDVEETHCDVSLSAHALQYCFDFLWGFDTLFISGIFDKPAKGHYHNMEEYAWIAKLNSSGKSMPGLTGRVINRLKSLAGIK